MDLRQLRYFLEIVDQGSISRAAQRLNVAQPALSIHLRNMEDRLGTALLIRRRSGVLPTEAGEALARHARLMLAEQARAEDEIRNLGRDPGGEVRLGLTGTISDIVTVPLIEAAAARYPRIRLTVSEAMSGFVASWLAEGRVDLAILYAQPSDGGTAGERLLDEELVLVAPPGTAGTAGATATLAGAAGTALILPSPAHGLRQMLDAEAAGQGLGLATRIEIDSYRNIKGLVMRGHGVSILPRHAVEAERAAGRLDALPFATPLWRSAWLVARTQRPPTRATEAIRALLREVVAELVGRGAWAGARLAAGTA